MRRDPSHRRSCHASWACRWGPGLVEQGLSRQLTSVLVLCIYLVLFLVRSMSPSRCESHAIYSCMHVQLCMHASKHGRVTQSLHALKLECIHVCLSVCLCRSIRLSIYPFIHPSTSLSLSLSLSHSRARALSLCMHVQAYSKEYRELLPAAHIAVWTPHRRWRRLVCFRHISF